MHGGLPFIGVSVLVYGVVGAVAIAREALRRCRRARPSGGAGKAVAGGAATGSRGVTAWPAASR